MAQGPSPHGAPADDTDTDVDTDVDTDIDTGRHVGPWGAWPAEVVHEPDVVDLIGRAEAHELGRTFLEKGALGAVAATFGVHAFLVDAARQRLAERP